MVDQFNNPTFAGTEIQNGVGFTTRDGFNLSADHIRSSVAFIHRMKAKAVSGGPPIMEMSSTPQPFTELLPVVSDKLIEITRLLPGISSRKINQVGIVSSTRAAAEDLPPGISRFIDYLKRPWGQGDLPAFSVEVISVVDETEHWTDRCQHKIVQPEDPDELMTLSFDFHRKFKSGQATSESQMRTLLNKGGGDALAYFERLAEGNMFDEHLISSKTDRI